MGAARTGRAKVTGPVRGGIRGTAFAPGCEVPGCVTEEYFLEGDAVAYAPADRTDYEMTGMWQAVPVRSAPFRTRVIVVRPMDPDRFGGTVLVNWQNVTRGFETGAPPADLAAQRVAWVGVSAQAVGHEGFPGAESLALRGWDPVRYATLGHPGDDFSFDIFTQAGLAVGPDRTARLEGPDPLGGMHVSRLVASGSSQSALRLRTYVNAVQPIERVWDGFFLTLDVGRGAELDTSRSQAGGPLQIPSAPARIRGDLGVPVMVVNSESEVPRTYPVRQPDTGSFRLWEVAGSAHISWTQHELEAQARDLAEVGIGASAGLSLPEDRNVLSHAPVMAAALKHFLKWVTDGVAPPVHPRVQVEAGEPPVIVRDDLGLAVGGVRLPDVEVPVAEHGGIRPDEDQILARICGYSRALPAAVLERLYPGPAVYLERYARAVQDAVALGTVGEADGRSLLARAREGYLGSEG